MRERACKPDYERATAKIAIQRAVWSAVRRVAFQHERNISDMVAESLKMDERFREAIEEEEKRYKDAP